MDFLSQIEKIFIFFISLCCLLNSVLCLAPSSIYANSENIHIYNINSGYIWDKTSEVEVKIEPQVIKASYGDNVTVSLVLSKFPIIKQFKETGNNQNSKNSFEINIFQSDNFNIKPLKSQSTEQVLENKNTINAEFTIKFDKSVLSNINIEPSQNDDVVIKSWELSAQDLLEVKLFFSSNINLPTKLFFLKFDILPTHKRANNVDLNSPLTYKTKNSKFEKSLLTIETANFYPLEADDLTIKQLCSHLFVFEPIKQVSKSEDKEPKIKISGFRQTTFRSFNSSGNSTNFVSQNGLTFFGDKIQQSTHLKFDGFPTKDIFVEGNFSDTLQGEEQASLLIKSKSASFSGGNINVSFPGGELNSFTKSISGMEVKVQKGKFEIGSLFSRSKSRQEYESFKGGNIKGPYKLKTLSLVEGSEIVKVDGRLLSKDEYSIDYFLGTIMFNSIIDPTTTIEIYYESSLLMELGGGELGGFYAFYKPNEKFKLGSSFTFQSANRNPRISKFKAEDEFTPSDIQPLILNSSTPLKLKHSFIEKYYESVVLRPVNNPRTLISGTDYILNYVSGELYLSSDLITALKNESVSPCLKVTYSYYNPKYIKNREQEEITGDGVKSEFTLKYEKIFSGTEKVKLYQNGLFIRDLIPDVDYRISEENNSIVFINNLTIPSTVEKRYALIDYLTITNESLPENKYRREVKSASFEAQLLNSEGKKVLLNAEVASSISDISAKAVPVFSEVLKVTSPAQKLECLNANIPDCFATTTFPLLVPNSESIYFNEINNYQTRLIYGKDYTINPTTGEIKFTTIIPENTIVYIDYQYYAGADDNLETGNAYLVRLNAEAGRLSVSGKYLNKDKTFVPISSTNDLKTSMLEYALKYKLTNNLNFYTQFSASNQAFGFFSNDKKEQKNSISELEFIRPNLPTIKVSFNTQSIKDNLILHRENNVLKNFKTVLSYKLPTKKDVSMNLSLENGKYSDRTDKTSDKKLTKVDSSFRYLISTSAITNFSFGINEVDYSENLNFQVLGRPLAFTNFTTKNIYKRCNLNWTLKETYYITANIDNQAIKDSRTNSKNYSLNSNAITIRLKDGKPFSWTHETMINYYQNWTPSTAGRTENSGMNFSTVLKLLRDLNLTTNFLRTDQQSYVQDNIQKNISTTIGLLFNYSKGQKNSNKQLNISVENRFGELKSIAFNFTTTDTRQTAIVFNYTFLKDFSLSFRAERNKHLQKYPSKQESTNENISCQLSKPIFGNKVEMVGKYVVSKSALMKKKEFDLSGKLSLTNNLSGNISFRNIDFKNRAHISDNYKGKVESVTINWNF